MKFRELFFPRTIKDKLLFSEKTIGLSIDGLTIHVAHIKAKRNGLTVQSFSEFTINSGDPRTYTQRLTAALKRVANKIDLSATIRATFPSSKVIIKELTVPFLDPEKIKKIIEYEVEPIIPFPLENAVIDFIVIDQSEVKESSTILVAAAQLNEVKKFVDIFKKAGIEPHVVTVDLFALASLFRLIPDYQAIKHDCAIIDVGFDSTRVGVMSKGKLVATRTINAQMLPDTSNYDSLFKELKFTLESFSLMKNNPLTLDKIVLVGPEEAITELQERCNKTLAISSEVFTTENIMSNKALSHSVGEKASEWRTYTRALGAALVDVQYQDFTLRHKEAELSLVPFARRAAIIGSLLTLFLFASIGISGYLDTKKLSQKIAALEKKEIKKLRQILPKKHKALKKKGVKALTKASQVFVSEQEEIWAPFSKLRLSPLEILQELTNAINKKKFDVSIDQILISGDEQEQHPIEVHGSFKSKTDSLHLKHFSDFEHDLNATKTLSLTEEIDPTPVEDGVQFVARFKQKEL